MYAKTLLQYRNIYSYILILFLIIISPSISAADRSIKKDTSLIYINMYIENGSKLNWELNEDGTITIDLAYDYERVKLNRAFEHWHFLLNARAGSEVTLIFQNFNEIYNGKHVPFNYKLSIGCVVSPDGKKWQPVPAEWIAGNKLKVTVKMESDSMFVAHVEPYRLSDLQSLLSGINGNSRIKIIPIGKSVEERQLNIIQVGDDKAPHRIFIRARAHPWEPGGNWVVEGIISTLLKDTRETREYLNNYTVYILPMANIDGVAHGVTRFNMNGMDLNRNLTKPADPVLSPENAAMEHWLEDLITKGLKPDLAIDFHNDSDGKIVFPLFGKKSDVHLKNFKSLENLLLTYSWFREGSSFSGTTSSSFEEGLLSRYGIESLVYELNAHFIKGLNKKPLSEDWMLLGKQLCTVFNEYFKVTNK